MKTCWQCPTTRARRAAWRVWRTGWRTPIHVCAHHYALLDKRRVERAEEIKPVADFIVPTYGIANTSPEDMPRDAFDAWIAAVVIPFHPELEADWRAKRRAQHPEEAQP